MIFGPDTKHKMSPRRMLDRRSTCRFRTAETTRAGVIGHPLKRLTGHDVYREPVLATFEIKYIETPECSTCGTLGFSW